MSPLFKYHTKDAKGIDRDGEIEALDLQDAVSKLRVQDLTVISLNLKESSPEIINKSWENKKQMELANLPVNDLIKVMVLVSLVAWISAIFYMCSMGIFLIPLVSVLIISCIFWAFYKKNESLLKGEKVVLPLIGTFLLFIVVFFMTKGCYSNLARSNIGIQSSSSNHSETQVCIYAQDFVRNKLASPSTAKFPSCSQGIVRNYGNGEYGYAGYVDSQNYYGATVRTTYGVALKFTGDQCILKDIQIGN